MATAGIFSSIGYFMVFTLGMFLSWRTVALVCVSVPVCILITTFFSPETPIWLLSKNQHRNALKSLQCLRGCVTPETVHDEYQKLYNYSITSKTCAACTRQMINQCEHTETWSDKFKQLMRKRVIKPFILITALQFFLQFCAIVSWRPYIIQILNAYNIQWNAHLTTVIMSSMGFFGRLFLLPLLKTLGKRKIYLLSSVVTFICCFGLSKLYLSTKIIRII